MTKFAFLLKKLRSEASMSQLELESKLINACSGLILPNSFPNPTNFPAKIISLWETDKKKLTKKKLYISIVRKLDYLLEANGDLIKAFENNEQHVTDKKTSAEIESGFKFNVFDVACIASMVPEEFQKEEYVQEIVLGIIGLCIKIKTPIRKNDPLLESLLHSALNLKKKNDGI